MSFLVENAENVCDRCDKPFASSEGLKEHMTRHKEKPVAKRKVLSHLPIKKCKSDENSVRAVFNCYSSLISNLNLVWRGNNRVPVQHLFKELPTKLQPQKAPSHPLTWQRVYLIYFAIKLFAKNLFLSNAKKTAGKEKSEKTIVKQKVQR